MRIWLLLSTRHARKKSTTQPIPSLFLTGLSFKHQFCLPSKSRWSQTGLCLPTSIFDNIIGEYVQTKDEWGLPLSWSLPTASQTRSRRNLASPFLDPWWWFQVSVLAQLTKIEEACAQAVLTLIQMSQNFPLTVICILQWVARIISMDPASLELWMQ
jgi:hypothetical protein